MKSWKKPTDELIEKALNSIQKGTGRKYFFSRLENPLWLKPLAERNCFVSPPKTQRYDDGSIIYPYWHELKYLRNVSTLMPDEVINIVLVLPDTDNPVIYDGILEIALELPGEYSVKLKDKIIHYAEMEKQFLTHRFADLLEHWIKEDQTSAAYELAKILIAFEPDPKSEEKRKQRAIANDWRGLGGTWLHPEPKFEHWEYRDIMSKGVLLLAEKEPYNVACLLIQTTSDMIYLKTHRDSYDSGADQSDAWCPRLIGQDGESEDREKTLVHTLISACEKVYENSPDAVAKLDDTLRHQRWNLFNRIRHHLYAKYPNDQTKPWIRDEILTHDGYGLYEHRYEFQQMIRCACEHYKDSLLTEVERTHIFDMILDGPSKENYRHWIEKWLGQEFTEEMFQDRQQRFHWMQLSPFESVLFEKYATHFKELKGKFNEPISDDDYPIYRNKDRTGKVSEQSIHKPENITNLTDEELLTFINEWEKSEEYSDQNCLEEITIEKLADAFQTLFRETIIPDANRLKFWMTNRKRIERPIYVRMMIYAMEVQVKEGNFNQLKEWFTFCEWVLSHPDREHDRDYTQGDESKKVKNWTNARRAVGDFVGVCLEKDVTAPISARKHIEKLLDMLCTQYDWNLDNNLSSVDRNNPLLEGVNNTRSRALESLFRFGIWLRRHEPECDIPEITTLLERRFSTESDYPLTLPEYAILGKYYPSIYNFNEKWAKKHKLVIFPKDKHSEWITSFSSFILCNGAYKSIFKIVKDDFNFALQHLSDFKKYDMTTRHPVDVFGERLFHYYLMGMFPLEGQESLLKQFYQQTENEREHWANVFKIIGDRLRSTGKDIDADLKDRVKTFFKWRLKKEEPSELRHFITWFQAECLEVEWRLKAYSKVIDICDGDVDNWEIYLRELCEMLPNHTTKVVECFKKLTDGILNNNIYIPPDEAKTILKAGLNSTDTGVNENAKCSINNLLKADKLEFMNLVVGIDK